MKGSKSSSPIDRQTSHRLPRSNSFYSPMGPKVDSPASNPLNVNTSSVLRYSHSAAMAIGRSLSPSFNVFRSPGANPGKLQQLLLQSHSNLSANSRGSSSSPLSAIENLESPSQRSSSPLFPSPLKVKEDVLVMDGILVGSSPRGRARAILDYSSSPSGASCLYKTEICRTWENSGSCHYGSKCQFAHGKEDLRPTPHSSKSTPEVCKPQVTPGSSSKRSRLVHHVTALPESAKCANMEEEEQWVVVSRTTALPDNWSPADDGIEVLHQSQKSPSREAIDEFIDKVLSGAITATRTPRLPVFAEICPE